MVRIPIPKDEILAALCLVRVAKKVRAATRPHLKIEDSAVASKRKCLQNSVQIFSAYSSAEETRNK